MQVADFVFWPVVALMIGCSAFFGPKIRGARIAMQWGTDGKPTWSAPKGLALWGMVAFMLAVRVLIWAAMTYTPSKVNGAELGLLIFSIVSAGSYLAVLRAAVRAN